MALIRQSLRIYYVKLFIIVLYTRTASCWNEMVHEAIALTAMSSIRDKNLSKLISALHGGDLVDFAYWGHTVESMIPQSSDLYVQPQYDKSCSKFYAECNNDDGLCLLNGIKFFYHRLLPNEIEKVNFRYPKDINFTDMDSIKYLVALIAELHDPMKFGLERDNFGRKIKVSVEHTPFFILTTFDTVKLVNDGDYKPVDKTLNEVIDSYLLDIFAERHQEFWYGGWTHVNSLGIKFHEEVEMFKRSLHNAFDIWGQETFHLLCTIYQKLIEHANEKGVSLGDIFSVNMPSDVQIHIVQLLQQHILLAGARISIVLNHILSTRSIDSGQTAIQMHSNDSHNPKTSVKLTRSISYLNGFLTNFTIFLIMALMLYVVINARNIKKILLKPVLSYRSSGIYH